MLLNTREIEMRTKIIGILALIASTNVYADAWVTSNKAGGEIIITDNVCYLKGRSFESLREGYARTPTGEVIHGCWYYDNGTVHMTYENSSQYAYPAQIFTKMNLF